MCSIHACFLFYSWSMFSWDDCSICSDVGGQMDYFAFELAGLMLVQPMCKYHLVVNEMHILIIQLLVLAVYVSHLVYCSLKSYDVYKSSQKYSYSHRQNNVSFQIPSIKMGRQCWGIRTWRLCMTYEQTLKSFCCCHHAMFTMYLLQLIAFFVAKRIKCK